MRTTLPISHRAARLAGIAVLAASLGWSTTVMAGPPADAPAQSAAHRPSTDGDLRIRFAPGTDHATVHGTFREGQDDRYVLRARAGQSMTIQLGPTGTGARLGVFAPDGSALPGGPGDSVTYRLPATGDYRIVIGGGRGDSSPTYSMTVTIPAGTSNPGTGGIRRVQFEPGTFGASRHDSVASGATKRYALRAGAGQTMVVQIDAAVDNATFSIMAPDGTMLSTGQTDSTVELPSDGDYIVEVHPSGGRAEYQISFWIAEMGAG